MIRHLLLQMNYNYWLQDQDNQLFALLLQKRRIEIEKEIPELFSLEKGLVDNGKNV